MKRKSLSLFLIMIYLIAVASIPSSAGDCSGVPGDVNNDGYVTGADVTYLVNCLYREGPNPPCLDQADVNGDCFVFFDDITYLVNYLTGGPAPQSCP